MTLYFCPDCGKVVMPVKYGLRLIKYLGGTKRPPEDAPDKLRLPFTYDGMRKKLDIPGGSMIRLVQALVQLGFVRKCEFGIYGERGKYQDIFELTEDGWKVYNALEEK